jgi:hypothetical protein
VDLYGSRCFHSSSRPFRLWLVLRAPSLASAIDSSRPRQMPTEQRGSMSRRLCVAAAFMWLVSAPAGETTPAGEVRDSGNFSPIVASLERSLEFYQLLGLEVPPAPGPGPRPFSVNPRLHSMLGTTGAKERHVSARIPGINMGVEPIEFQDIDRRPVRPRVQDPGAVTLVLLVRAIDPMLARLKQSGVPVVTPGGMPVSAAGS